MSAGLADPDLTLRLALDEGAPRAARRQLEGIDGPSQEFRQALLLLTSELVTRAVQQCRPDGGEVELRVWLQAQRARVELHAPSKIFCPPLERTGPSYDLVLLGAIADRWSIETALYPPCMWFELQAPSEDWRG